MQAGYSQRPLAAKLGIKAAMRIALLHAPADYHKLLEPLPNDVIWVDDLGEGGLDFVQYFTTARAALDADFAMLKTALRPAAMLWVSWPKRAAKVPTDLDENIVREIGLAHGLVDVKVAAIDLTWSGLKFVYRLTDRAAT
jgi:hypothetical protein